MKTVTYLRRLERIKTDFSPGSARKKQQLLSILGHMRLSSPHQLVRLHDLLCFIYAYPDNREIFQLARSMITGFDRRSDLRRYRHELASSGIAGTTINYRFYWPMARWLKRNWPEQFHLDADDIERPEKLASIVPLLVPYSESGGFDDFDYSPLEWLERLKGNGETTARFFISRLEHTYRNDFEREAIHDDLSPGYQLFPGPGTPDIGNTVYKHARIALQSTALDSSRPDPGTSLRDSTCVPRRLSVTAGEELLDLARKTMVTHERDLDAFSYGNPRDVSPVDYSYGYQTVCIGILPERRYLIHATYGLLNLKKGMNAVPGTDGLR